VNFLEVDYPATCVEKTKIITQVLAPLEAQANNLYFLPVDFNQKLWPEKMTEVQGFDPSKKTFFICEGVLMYLEEASVINLFSNLRTLTFEESKIIFTCVEPMKSKKNNVSFLLKLYLQLKGEPLCWTIEQEYLPDFLAVQGYKTQALINHEGFQDHYLKNHKYRGTLHQGEYIVIAEIL
jgi:methyltransferase (TIGR00027 family)